MAVLTQLSNSTAYVSTVMPAEILLGLGIGCVMAPAASLATSGIDPRDAGIASAALNTSTQLGASIGTAVLNSVATAATASYVAAGRGDALAHGYAAAAIVGAVVLSLAALVAASASGSAAASSKS
jgi:3-oxoacyl-(acyl-carrier-protein) synthase